jgi:hypothetical protein
MTRFENVDIRREKVWFKNSLSQQQGGGQGSGGSEYRNRSWRVTMEAMGRYVK